MNTYLSPCNLDIVEYMTQQKNNNCLECLSVEIKYVYFKAKCMYVFDNGILLYIN